MFHSFRHLVKRQLRNAKVQKGLIDALQGQEAKDVADRYGLDEEGLMKASKVDFSGETPEIRLSGRFDALQSYHVCFPGPEQTPLSVLKQ